MDDRIPPHARALIEPMLQRLPEERPTAEDAKKHALFIASPLPTSLPESILSREPRLNLHTVQAEPRQRMLSEFGHLSPIAGGAQPPAKNGPSSEGRTEDKNVALEHVAKLEEQLCALLQSGFQETALLPMDSDDAADPAATPVYWVTKWVDCTDEYGFGYQLCDNSLGVLFNDLTRMVLLPGDQIHFIDHRNRESYHTITAYPKHLKEKVVLIKRFRQYMHQHLMTAGADVSVSRAMDVAQVPYLRVWFRTQPAIVLFLSNGTLQLNFFRDHTKIILCPLMGAVSYIDKSKNFRTYSLQTMHQKCPSEIAARLKYAQSLLARIKENLQRI